MNRRSFFTTSAGSAALAATVDGCTAENDKKYGKIKSTDAIGTLAGMSVAELREKYRADLFDEYLPFLEQHVIDHEFGGFMCNTSPDGTQISTDKRAGYEGRGMWVYSFLYNNQAHEQKYLDIATGSAEILLKTKPEGDAMWPGSFDRRGNPAKPPGASVNADLYIAEGFAEYAKATGDTTYYDLAKDITMKCLRVYDSPGYALDVVKRYPGVDVSEITGVRIMDDWMLFLRAATHLLDSKQDADMENLAARCVDTITNKYYNPAFGLVTEMVNYDHSQFDNDLGQHINFGNDFQALWHTMDEALRIKDKALFETAAVRLKRHIEVAWDDVYGGVFNSLEHVDENRWRLGKTHYAQAETLVGLLMVIEHSGAQWASDLFTQVYKYVGEKFPQKQYGYPLWILGSDRKVSFRKDASRIGNFHQPRHLMLNLTSLDRILERGGEISGIFRSLVKNPQG